MAAEVQIVVGPARSGKTGLLLKGYREFLRTLQWDQLAGEGLWLCPSHRSVAALRDTLVEGNTEGFLDPRLMTFAQFAETVVAKSARLVRPISRLQQRRILQRVVKRLLDEDKLRHFAPVAATPGFLLQVGQWIAELKRQDIWAEDFRKRVGDPRDRDLSNIYGAYQRELQIGNLYDAEGRFWAAREVLQDQPAVGNQDFGLVVVDGFTDFTTAQFDILQILAQRSARLNISLTGDPDCLETGNETDGRTLLFAKVRNTLARLRELLPDAVLQPCVPTHWANASLQQAEKRLFAHSELESTDETPTESQPIGVEIFAANGNQGEIEEIARRVKRLLLAGSVRPQDILIVFPRLGESADRVREVCCDFGIPVDIESQPRLAACPLVRAVIGLLRLELEDWPFRQLLGTVTNRLFSALDPTDSNSDARVALEHCIRAAQIPRGKKRLLDQLRYWEESLGVGEDNIPDADVSPASERTKLALRAALALPVLKELADCLDEFSAQASLDTWIERVQGLLAKLGCLTTKGYQDSQVQESTAWKPLHRGLLSIGQIDKLASDEPSALGLQGFLELVEMVAAELTLPRTHDDVGRVRVLSAESARHVSAPHVFLAGLSEQAFSAAETAGRLSLDSDFKRPNTLEEVALSREAAQSEAMLLFSTLVTRATESLTLSYPALDKKGQSLPPCPLLNELEQAFVPHTIPKTTQPLSNATFTDEMPLSISATRQQAVSRALENDPSWLADMAGSTEAVNMLDGIECIAARADREHYSPYEGLLLNRPARQALGRRFGTEHLWSPSQLESYATCPFRFFNEQLLSLEPLAELTLRNDARRRGSLLHQVLASVHQQISEQLDSLDADQRQSVLTEQFRKTLDAEIAANPLRGLEQALREIERREIEAWAPDYAQQECDYRVRWDSLDEPLRPKFLEVRFGPQVLGQQQAENEASTALPFELDLGNEQIRITGQIDRIDVGRVGNVTVFNIIDYKSGKEVRFSSDKVRAGRQLQLPLYALAAEQLLLADQEAQALSTGYWNIRGKGFEKGAFDIREADEEGLHVSDQWPALRDDILERVQQLVSGIRAGEFPVYNEDENCTRSCNFRTICRIAQIRSLGKEWLPTKHEKKQTELEPPRAPRTPRND